MRRNYFGPAQFARVGKLFQDLPLEALDKSVTGLNDAYSANLEKFNAIEAAISAVESSDDDAYVKQEKIKNLQDRIANFAKTDGFENADRFAGKLAAEVIADQDLQTIAQNYKLQQEDQAIARELQAQGITAIDARDFYNGEDFRSITVDEFGNKSRNTYRAGFMRPGEYDAAKTKLFDQMPERGGTYFVDGPNGSKIAKTWTGIRSKDIDAYKDMAYARYKEMDEFKTEMIDLQVQGYTPEQAEQIIKESVTATGKERVGTKSHQQLYGYKNPYDMPKGNPEDPQIEKTKFINEHRTLKFGDTNSWDLLGAIVPGIPRGKDEAGLLLGGTSAVPVDSAPKTVSLEPGFFKIEKGESADNPYPIDDIATFEGSQKQPVQGYIFAEGEDEGKIALVGEAQDGIASKVDPGTKPYLKDGHWYVSGTDDREYKVKPQNFKMYTDTETDDTYLAPITSRQEDLLYFGKDNMTTARPIETSARGNGNYSFDNSSDINMVGNKVNSIISNPQMKAQASGYVLNTLVNKANMGDPMAAEVYLELDRRFAAATQSGHPISQADAVPISPADAVGLLYSMLSRETVTIEGNERISYDTKINPEIHELTARGQYVSELLNDVIMDYEEKTTDPQNYYKSESVGLKVQDRINN